VLAVGVSIVPIMFYLRWQIEYATVAERNKMKNSTFAIIAVFTGMCSIADAAAPADLDKYNVVWDSPSADARGSMPIGNGDIGLNVWVDPSGDLLFFIGKTDAWDENMRLLKLGKIRVKLTPALTTTNGFRQELKLRNGVIEIKTGYRVQDSGFRKELKTEDSEPGVLVRLWVDANK